MNSVSSPPVSENLLCTGIQFVMSITVIPHPFRVLGGGGGGGGGRGVTLAACPLRRAFAIYGNCYCTFADLCSSD